MHKIAFYDLETTGTDHKEHRITEIAMMYEDLKTGKKDTFHKYIKYDKYPENYKEVAELTGLTPEILAEKGEDEATVYQALNEWLASKVDRYNRDDKIITGGYNISKFDDQFLRAMFDRFGNQYYGSFISFLKLDLVTLFGLAYLLGVVPHLKNTKLETFKEYFKIKAESHSAIEDVQVTKLLWDKMLQVIASKIVKGPVAQITKENLENIEKESTEQTV